MVEFAVSIPVFAFLVVIGVQALFAAFIFVRLQLAADAGARWASMMLTGDRAVLTQAEITAKLNGISNPSLEFCPVETLLSNGNCPSGAGAINPGGVGQYVAFRTSASVPLAVWPAPLVLSARRVVRNEAW